MSRPRIRMRDARRSLRALLRDPEQTERVLEIGEALAGRQPQRLLTRVRRSHEGARLLRERPLVDASSCDLRELLRLPHGTFGHEFARWMLDNELEPGLMQREPSTRDPELAYLSKRVMQVHDFWHVLSGYNRDPIGELGVLAFTYGQSHPRGIGFILLSVLARNLRESWRETGRLWSPLLPYLWQGYRRGRHAVFLPELILEDYYPLPIDSVRQLLRVEPLQQSFNPEALPPIAAPHPVPCHAWP